MVTRLRLSKTQLYWLNVLAGRNFMVSLEQGSYIPSIRDERTFVSLVDKGLVTWREPALKPSMVGGYVLTKSGKEWAASTHAARALVKEGETR